MCVSTPRIHARPFHLDHSMLMCGCASEAMELLPARSIQTVVTSPPYWSLRDYDVDRQIGRDDPLNQYLQSIVAMFEKLRNAYSPTTAPCGST